MVRMKCATNVHGNSSSMGPSFEVGDASHKHRTRGSKPNAQRLPDSGHPWGTPDVMGKRGTCISPTRACPMASWANPSSNGAQEARGAKRPTPRRRK
eukprot:5305320-Pyramimonas_sp.AAC.1